MKNTVKRIILIVTCIGIATVNAFADTGSGTGGPDKFLLGIFLLAGILAIAGFIVSRRRK